MHETRKMWASVVVVGAIVVAGASVAAAASAGMLDNAGEETRVVVERSTPSGGPAPSSTPTEDVVVSEEVNPVPGEVLDYWTDERMEDADPMPMPEVTTPEIIVTE